MWNNRVVCVINGTKRRGAGEQRRTLTLNLMKNLHLNFKTFSEVIM